MTGLSALTGRTMLEAPYRHMGWIPYANEIQCIMPRSKAKRAAPARVLTPIFE